MPIAMNGRAYKMASVLTGPNTYDADLTPIDMQTGRTAYVKGKKIIGTGRSFEFAFYGRTIFKKVKDENGEEKYGNAIEVPEGANVIIISPCKGDAFAQDTIFVELEKGVVVQIGTNQATNSAMCVYHNGEELVIYSAETLNTKSQFFYFVGKDNYL